MRVLAVQQKMAMVDYSNIPESTMQSLKQYQQEFASTGKIAHPGSFFSAVFNNDLVSAVLRADAENLAALRNIVGYIVNEFGPGAIKR